MPNSSSLGSLLTYFHRIASSNSSRALYPITLSCAIPRFFATESKVINNPNASQWLPLTSRSIFFPPPPNVLFGSFGRLGSSQSRFLASRNLLGVRCFSLYRNFARNLVKSPGLAVKTALARYGDAVRLHIEAFWKRNYLVVVGAGGVAVCILLWKVLFGIASAFVGVSEGVAKYGFLALSSATVAFAGLYFRLRYTISPDKVYWMAMRKLNTSPGILEVMGAPLAGTDLRAYIMSGGGMTLKNFQPRLRIRRCFLIFPIRGSERKALVSVEVKKKNGQYDMKLLSVDIPMASGPDQRLFLIGDEEGYSIGGGLIYELRDPVLKALAAADEFEARDEKEDKEDAARELEEIERRHREEVEKIEKGNSQ